MMQDNDLPLQDHEPAGHSRSPQSARDEDCARVEIRTPWSPEALRVFVQDVERLLRINPFYEFELFDWVRPGRHARLKGINHANGMPFDLSLHVDRKADGLQLQWQGWLKPETRVEIRDDGHGGSSLVIVDDYSSLPKEERRRRRNEADSSLLAWGHALSRHLRWRSRLSLVPGAIAILDRLWLRMKPSARRISAMIVIVTLAELLVFAAVFTIFWLEWHS